MQRLCSKLRSFSQISSISKASTNFSPSIGQSLNNLCCFSSISSQFKHQFHVSSTTLRLPRDGFHFNSLGFNYVQTRNFSAKSKEKKWKKMTPATSRVKKIKMKTISAFKGRFRTLNDGTIRRWREGKRHNAHLKSKKSKRRLRKPEIVPAAYAKVMKKMNFCAHY